MMDAPLFFLRVKNTIRHQKEADSERMVEKRCEEVHNDKNKTSGRESKIYRFFWMKIAKYDALF